MTSEAPMVLVVEDEPQLQRILRLTLEANGMRHMETTNAAEAINRIRNNVRISSSPTSAYRIVMASKSYMRLVL